MVVQVHKYWFIFFMHPQRGPIIYKSDAKTEYEAEAWARNQLGTKSIKYGIKGLDTCGPEAYRQIKAECLKMTGDIDWADRSAHNIPAEPIENEIQEI